MQKGFSQWTWQAEEKLRHAALWRSFTGFEKVKEKEKGSMLANQMATWKSNVQYVLSSDHDCELQVRMQNLLAG